MLVIFAKKKNLEVEIYILYMLMIFAKNDQSTCILMYVVRIYDALQIYTRADCVHPAIKSLYELNELICMYGLQLLSSGYLSGSRSRNLNGELIAPSQNSFSSAINGNCTPDFAQYVKVSKDAVSANTAFNLTVFATEVICLGMLPVLCVSKRIRLPVFMRRLSPIDILFILFSSSMTESILACTTEVVSNSPRSVRPCACCSSDEWLGIYLTRCIFLNNAIKESMKQTCSHSNNKNKDVRTTNPNS